MQIRGADDYVQRKLEEEVHADQTYQNKGNQISGCHGAEGGVSSQRTAEEQEHTQNEQTGIHNGADNGCCQTADVSLRPGSLADAGDHVVHKPCEEARRSSLADADQRGCECVVGHQEDVEHVAGGEYLNEGGQTGKGTYDQTGDGADENACDDDGDEDEIEGDNTDADGREEYLQHHDQCGQQCDLHHCQGFCATWISVHIFLQN